ncbi:LuxR1 [Desulforapulum autotrophicum HRM2]|uniref:LuxR1 n=2 Tax=Desulforapulum autotrophicum TaxID=2296 RepID=C0QFU7_DESAH|nr:LuxR1 [Desulforapulum autotrophicum HRM2]
MEPFEMKKNILEKMLQLSGTATTVTAIAAMGFFLSLLWGGIFKTHYIARAETLTLTYATNTEPVGLRGIAEKGFIDEIEKLGKGRIKIKVYWRQSYLIDKEILEGVKDGTVDMGHVNINYYPKRLVKNGGITLLQQGPDRYEDRIWVYNKIYQDIPELGAEFENYKQKIIYTYSVLPLAGCFTREATSLGDFKDRRIRASSRWLLKILEGAGAIPVDTPWKDSYLALKTNALEGVFTNIDAIHRINLDEIAPHIVIFRELWNPVPFHVTINLPRWNSLPRDIQTVIELASENASKRFANIYRPMLDEIVSDQRKAGYTVTFATKKDIQDWLALKEIEKVKAQWIKEVNLVTVNGNAGSILEKIEQIAAQGIMKQSGSVIQAPPALF